MLSEVEQQIAPHLFYQQAQTPARPKLHRCWGGYYSSPQWIIFGITFSVSVLLCLLMATQVFTSGYHLYIGRGLMLYLLYRYLSLAFSDPGVAADRPLPDSENSRYCDLCRIHVRKYTRHCRICEVCVQGYDHHCVFVGKCIGSGNMGEFKQFLCLIFSTLVYGLVLSVTVAGNVHRVQSVVPPQ